ncbi:MAG TPA: hypothetical protein VF799_02910 [Geobacteraceae bacterium]
MAHNPLLEKMMESFVASMESEFAEEFLETLLRLMSLALLFDHDYRRNVIGFSGRYQFLSSDGAITVAALFNDDAMEVREEVITEPNITVTFKDGKALMGYLLSPKPDVLGSMLRQEVRLDGNLNYLYKFAYMAKRLQLMATGAL